MVAPGSPGVHSQICLVVQRVTASDLAHWMDATTPFPERHSIERSYTLSPAYDKLFSDVLAYCRETIRTGAGLGVQQQRVRYWAAIALLRCILSSPAAAEAVLEKRRATVATPGEPTDASAEEIDAQYCFQVLDPADGESTGDFIPVAPIEEAGRGLPASESKRLDALLARARKLAGPEPDAKLKALTTAVRDLLSGGSHPIVFCRYIATAHYVADWLTRLLGPAFPGLRVVAITGEIGDDERRERITHLAQEPMRVLVATDCLSEGINLQDHFDGVIHADIPWNPNRLEQREGRIDRFGQSKTTVETVLLYSADNAVDQVVLDVLVRKARAIRRDLGVAVPVAVEAEQVVQAVVDSVLLGQVHPAQAQQLSLFAQEETSRFHAEWDRAVAREKRFRAYFAQHGIKPDDVALDDPTAVYLGRTHPLVAAYCDTVLGAAFAWECSNDTHGIARCGAIFTDAVRTRTGVALLRLRYLLREKGHDGFAEEVESAGGNDG